VTSQARAFFALDFGSATTSAALVGLTGGRWRLVAHAAVPASTDLQALLAWVVDGVQRDDARLLAELSGEKRPAAADLAAGLPTLQARSTPARRISVLAGSQRQRLRLEAVAKRAGWLVAGGSAEEDGQVELARLVYSPDSQAVLLGADDMAASDERRHLPLLAALAGAAAGCRPELTVVLAGGAAAHEATFWESAGGPPEHVPAADADPRSAGSASPASASGAAPLPWAAAGQDGGRGLPGTPSGHLLLAPDATAGRPDGSALQQVLEGLRAAPNDSRLGIARSTASLASVLDRSIETVEIGLDGALRCRAQSFGKGGQAVSSIHAAAGGSSLAPRDLTDEALQKVLAWSTVSLDRYRLTDRLRDLRQLPWGEVEGEGALFRLAAAKAALDGLVEATPEMSAEPMPHLLVVCGGVWAAFPPAVAVLALADLVRRSGVSQIAWDHARLLGPLGAIESEDDRRGLLADLADDLLVPLGALIVPGGLRSGRSAGRMRIRRLAVEGAAAAVGVTASGVAADEAARAFEAMAGTNGATPAPLGEIELEPGKVEVLALPPGRRVTAEFDFRDMVVLGGRGRHFVVEISGGLGGLVLDLRDVPLRLPDRPEPRRAALEAWLRSAWVGLDE
jgi:hypothetical protein